MSIPTIQAEAAHFLRNLTGAEPIETHISAIFRDENHAWKLKKAVSLPYLDFSSLGQRLHFLERELELNRRTAPEIYLRVRAIYRREDGRLALTQGDEPLPADALEYVLQMARIPDGDLYDAIALRGALKPEMLTALADVVFAFHAGLDPLTKTDWADQLSRIIDGNRVAALRTVLDPVLVTRWYESISAVLRADRSAFAARGAGGFVRRGHGDLHLGNICQWNSRPTLFDALEFDEALGTIDIGFDLAFLLMDLDRRVGRPAANLVFNRVIARNGDSAMVPLMPLYISLRAMVRAHVTALVGDVGIGQKLLGSAIDDLQSAAVALIAIGGLPGSGKSTLARRIAPLIGNCPGALILRHDEIRKQLAGVAPEQKLDASFYTPSMNARVDRHSLDLMASTRFSRSMIVDATCRDPVFRGAIEATARAHGVKFLGFWLTASPATLERRIGTRKSDASDADIALLHTMIADAPSPPADWQLIDTTRDDGGLAAIRDALERRSIG